MTNKKRKTKAKPRTPFKVRKLGGIGRPKEYPLMNWDVQRKRWKMNSRIISAMKSNPMSYKMPTEYIFNADTGKIEEAELYFKQPVARRMLRDDMVVQYEVKNGNFLEPAFLDTQRRTAFGGLINSFQNKVHRNRRYW